MTFPAYIESTFIENWSAELLALSMRTETVAMTPDDVVALGSFSPAFRKEMGLNEVFDLSENLVATLQQALSLFPSGVMPRLGYCSWKASMLVNSPVRTLKELLAVITRPDNRIARVLVNAAAHRNGLSLHLREWMEMPPESEFRVFIERGKVSGVSQYFWQDTFDFKENLHSIRLRLKDVIGDILPVLHMDSVIADIHVRSDGSDRALLIELNPFVDTADLCLFQARDFDGRLRFTDRGRVMAVAIA